MSSATVSVMRTRTDRPDRPARDGRGGPDVSADGSVVVIAPVVVPVVAAIPVAIPVVGVPGAAVVAVVAVLSPDQIAKAAEGETGVLLAAVKTGMPDFPVDTVFPFLTVFAVANTALINMLMASRLIYGMAKQNVLPSPLGKVLPGRRSPWAGIVFTTVLALALIVVVSRLAESSVTALAGTTGLLLLLVFSIVNVAAFVLRKDEGDGRYFRTPSWTPVLGAVACLFLAGPWARTDDQMVQYKIAAGMVGVGVVLWLVTWVSRRGRTAAPPVAAE